MIFDSHYSQPYLYGAHPVSSVHTLCTPHTHKRPREVECVICACLHKLHGSEQLTWLLSNGENPSSGTVGAKQCTGSNNNPPPTLFCSPQRERARESSTYCITTRGNDTNPDNFHHHGWEQLGLVISEILLLKYSQ